ncbi:MAG: HEAT repeat domain-containing protein [Elusimicrobia bacterium]|nr:HEAT repeat domain-containing protein [Elusimicrobiota bacterium]
MTWKPRSRLTWARPALAGLLLLCALPCLAQFPPEVDVRGTEMRSSLMLVIYLCFLLFGSVVILALYIFCLKAYHRLRRGYRDERKKFFQQGIELLLMEEPFEAVLAAFQPVRPGDVDIVQELILHSMRFITGPPFDILRKVAHKLGIIERNLKLLSSMDRHARGRAVENLGIMRATQAIVPILGMLKRESNDIRMVALRSLALIRDPRALPYFHHAAKDLPPPLLPRVASIMLEFGPRANSHLVRLVETHRSVFPPLMLEELLRELAASSRRPGA